MSDKRGAREARRAKRTIPDRVPKQSEAKIPELFHVISDPGSARARRLVVELALEEAVRFRNLAYDEVRADFTARGGVTTPALWDGERLTQGDDAVAAALAALSRSRR